MKIEAIKSCVDINTKTQEGRYLMAALAILTTQSKLKLFGKIRNGERMMPSQMMDVLYKMQKLIYESALDIPATPSIYIASKTKHAAKWLALRDKGVNIISTWIDEAGEGQTTDMPDLCSRCIHEAEVCNAMIVYAEDGDILKGALVELGVALAVTGKPIFFVGPVLRDGSVFTHHPSVSSIQTVEEAIELIESKSIKHSRCY
jgi:hypothetical protein